MIKRYVFRVGVSPRDWKLVVHAHDMDSAVRLAKALACGKLRDLLWIERVKT